MRILFVHERIGFRGGAERNLFEAAAALRERGHVCALAWSGEEGREAARFGEAFDACFEFDDDAALAAFAEDFRPDTAYVHILPSLPEAIPARRVVRMVHDHDLCCPRRHKYYAWTGRVCHRPAGPCCWLDAAFLARDRSRRFGVRWVDLHEHARERARNRTLDALLVGSRFMREELVMNGFAPERVHVLPPVVRMDGARATPVPRERRVLFVGQLIRGKGVDLLLRALARLSCDFEATIVGTGNAGTRLQVLARRLGLADRVSFVGWVEHEAVGACYAAARVAVVPSRWPEPFGMVGLEAMRHGRPVAAFAVGGIPDWLEHGRTGLLAPEQNVPALADALERLLTDDALAARMGGAAAERARSAYDFGDYVRRLERHLSGEGEPVGP